MDCFRRCRKIVWCEDVSIIPFCLKLPSRISALVFIFLRLMLTFLFGCSTSSPSNPRNRSCQLFCGVGNRLRSGGLLTSCLCAPLSLGLHNAPALASAVSIPRTDERASVPLSRLVDRGLAPQLQKRELESICRRQYSRKKGGISRSDSSVTQKGAIFKFTWPMLDTGDGLRNDLGESCWAACCNDTLDTLLR